MKDIAMKDVDGFVSAEGRRIVNGAGREILLRGVGLGSWLLPEGYMWCFPDKGDRPRRIEKMIVDLIGHDEAEQFWQTYFDRYITEDDIRKISEEGFNSIRLPINSRYLKRGDIASGRIDRLIEWCKKHHLYVILDLHGAPGGQTGTNIDDSESDLPELFIEGSYAAETVSLWRDLAIRYRDEWIVAAYDLLNEPLPQWFSQYNDKVVPLYKEIISAIREVDKRHMIILEGVHWATDWSIFTEKLDDNLMLQFHKYWNSPDRESLEPYLKKSEELNVPIFMGEGGENNTDWYYGVFQLYEDYNISWNFWTWKKMDTGNSPCSIEKPLDWDYLIDFLEGKAAPDSIKARSVLNEYLENIVFQKCRYNKGVPNSILGRAPLRIPAVFFSNIESDSAVSKEKLNKKKIGFRDNESVEIGFSSGIRDEVNFKHYGGESWGEDDWMFVQISPGDKLTYNFQVGKEGEFEVSLKCRSSDELSSLLLSVEPGDYKAEITAESQWTEKRGNGSFVMKQCAGTIRLQAIGNTIQVERIEFLSH